ncbi:FAS1-like dehydratase domain-containing protein [Streptomyces cucumeris]|uniref:MaoC family dehydratase n=1 Tax=Streptomyces cucumeris TaxID=2962890 RepID=UPI003D74DFE9
MTYDTQTRSAAPAADAAIAELVRAGGRIAGHLAPDVEPGVGVASWINVSRFVEATGDENPLYTDVQYGAGSVHHTMLAPPAFVLAVRMPDSSGGLDLDRHGLLDTLSTLRLTWNDTIRLGDPLTGRVEITGLAGHHDGAGRPFARVTSAVDYLRHGVPLARGSCEVDLTPRDPQAPARSVHRYDDTEVERMVHELETEEPPRGGRPRFWSDTAVGETGPTLLKGPLSLAELMVWVFAEGRPVRAGNLHHDHLADLPGRQITNPVTDWPAWDRADAWLDSATAHTAGLPAPAARGGLLFSLAVQYATHWMGDDAFLRRLETRITRPLVYGDALRLTGTVTDRYTATDEAGVRHHAVTLRIAGVNQRHETVLDCAAAVFLPERGRMVTLPVAGGLTPDGGPASDHPGGE